MCRPIAGDPKAFADFEGWAEDETPPACPPAPELRELFETHMSYEWRHVFNALHMQGDPRFPAASARIFLRQLPNGAAQLRAVSAQPNDRVLARLALDVLNSHHYYDRGYEDPSKSPVSTVPDAACQSLVYEASAEIASYRLPLLYASLELDP